MIKLSDIIKSGGGNAKINRFINRYVLSKKEKKDIIDGIKEGGESSSKIDEDCYYILSCYGEEIRSDFQGNSNLLITIPQMVIRSNLSTEKVIPTIIYNTYFGMNFDQSIGAIVIPKMINGVDGILITINTLMSTEIGQDLVEIINMIIKEYGELTTYTFINAINGMNDGYGLKIVSKEECYRICKYKDDEKV